MKKATKRIFSVILVICILTTGLGALAQENVPQIVPFAMGSHICAIGAGLTITSSGFATCTSSLELMNTTDTATTYMYLQRLVNGSWTNVDSWSISGSIYIAQEASEYVMLTNYYRVHVIAYVFSAGTLVEIATQDSYTVYCR